MKILLSVFVFAATLVLTMPTLAEEGHGGGHGNIAEKMNSLFPEPQAQLNKREVPAKPELVSPAFNTEVKGDKTTLQWKEVTGAEEYHVQIATDANFKWLVTEDFHVKGTSFEATGLGGGTKYFWRVAGVNSKNWSTFRKGFFSMSSFQTGVAAK